MSEATQMQPSATASSPPNESKELLEGPGPVVGSTCLVDGLELTGTSPLEKKSESLSELLGPAADDTPFKGLTLSTDSSLLHSTQTTQAPSKAPLPSKPLPAPPSTTSASKASISSSKKEKDHKHKRFALTTSEVAALQKELAEMEEEEVEEPNPFDSKKPLPTSFLGKYRQARKEKKREKVLAEYDVYLQKSKEQEFSDIFALEIVYHSGTDALGRPIIIFIASRLNVKTLNLEKFLLYLIHLLDPLVAKDYVMIFVTSGVSNANRPPFGWLKKVYRIFNRKYKKNLKRLFILHPTWGIRAILKLFRRFISEKFWKKVVYAEDVSAVMAELPPKQVKLPDEILKYRNSQFSSAPPLFGVSLKEAIREGEDLPAIVTQSIAYLKSMADTEGLFRLSGSASQINSLKQAFTRGEAVDLELETDPNAVAGVLKLFLRELSEPLFPFEVYPQIIRIQQTFQVTSNLARWQEQTAALLTNLPTENLLLLLQLLELLVVVAQHEQTNKMTTSNLAIVFAPNLMRSEDETCASVIHDTPLINSFMRKLIENNKPVLERIKEDPLASSKLPKNSEESKQDGEKIKKEGIEKEGTEKEVGTLKEVVSEKSTAGEKEKTLTVDTTPAKEGKEKPAKETATSHEEKHVEKSLIEKETSRPDAVYNQEQQDV